MALPAGESRDRDQLHQLGYAQELRRGMRTFSNFAVSFTIISILSGCLTLFGFAMNVGGPAVTATWPSRLNQPVNQDHAGAFVFASFADQ